MKKQPAIVISKGLASVNIFIAAVVLFVCYINLRIYYQDLVPNSMNNPSKLYFFTGLIVFAVLSFAASIIFLLNKKAGWWFLTIFTVLITASSVFNTTKAIIYTPNRPNLELEIAFAIFYVISTIIYISKPVRIGYRIIKKDDNISDQPEY